MKKRLLTTFAATLSLFMSQCSELPTQKETADGSKAIRIEIKTPPGFDTIAARAYVQVTADDMKATITQKLTISNDWISGVVRNIPVGYARHFEVFVEGFDSTFLYYGDMTASIYSGKETYVTIILRKPGGTAIINGYIEEYQPPQDSIPAPQTPYIYSYDIAPTTPPRISQLTMVTSGSKFPDSLFYIWRIVYIADYDSFSTKDTSGMVYTLKYPEDGMYQVSVRAMSMYDSLLISSSSYALVFNIKNGLLTDTILPDTVSPVIYLNGPDTIFLELNSSYTEQGAKAYDNVDGDLTKSIKISGYVDSSKVGVYSVSYTVSDKSLNVRTVSRIIIVSNLPGKDTIPPVLTLLGTSIIYLSPGDTFIEPGFTAIDNVDGNITSRVKTVFQQDSNSSNITNVIYSVIDMAGNATYAKRILIETANPLPTPSRPVITSSKVTDSLVSISFKTSQIKPVDTGTVEYNWAIYTTVPKSKTVVTTTLSKLTRAFRDNNTYSILVQARCNGTVSSMSELLTFVIEDGVVIQH